MELGNEAAADLKARILIIEDETRSAFWLKTYLEREGYEAETAGDGQTGLRMARRGGFDLIILDLMLPLISGSEICGILRRESDIPIIMITARGSREDRISGLDEGADDYIVKPYDPEEVIVRIKAILRRTLGRMKSGILCGRIRVNLEEEAVSVDDIPVTLSHTQFAVFSVLIQNPGAVLTRRQIINMAFPDNFEAYERAVDTHIKRLRKIIHREGFEPIKTVYGGGYKLVCGSH